MSDVDPIREAVRQLRRLPGVGEKTASRFVYHLLGQPGAAADIAAALAALEGIGPDRLRVRALLDRLRDRTVREVILATDPDIEGDATALYLARLLTPLGVEVTRLAHGISVGTEIEYADPLSLTRALQNRVALR